MSKVDNAEGMVIIGAAVLAVIVGYKVYSSGKKISDAVSDSVSSTVTGVSNAASNAYAEVKTFLTGNQYYSPAALDGSMSRADAIKLADQIEKRSARDSALSAAEWDNPANVPFFERERV